jgi:hypothetical protein
MTEVLLFHHALGQTPGFVAFAERLREAGHTVHTPDLYEGRTFTELDAGVAFAEEVGFPEIIARGVAAAADLPDAIVYAGFSLGALPTPRLRTSLRRSGLSGLRPGVRPPVDGPHPRISRSRALRQRPDALRLPHSARSRRETTLPSLRK